jgi:hypothetical protein
MARIGIWAGITLAGLGLAGAAAPDEPWRAAICQARTTCNVAAVTPAGKAADGTALSIVEIALGLADKPEDAEDEGCHGDDGESRDGGVEYWLIAGTAAPKRVLKLCNDGYGAAGIGEDSVKIGENTMAHTQSGGSNDRWQGTRRIRLSPPALLGIESCGYRATDPGSGVTSRTDVATMTTRLVALDDRDPHAKADDVECPAIPATWSATPGPALLAGYAIPLPQPPALKDFPPGTALGDCAMHLGGTAPPGFTVFGTPDPARLPELWLTALDRQHLVIQLYEPKPAPPGSSWVSSDHLEIWTSTDTEPAHNRPDAAKANQIGIGLDGQLYVGAGKPILPRLQRHEIKDAGGRTLLLFELAWPQESDLLGGVTIAYSQADAGKQARIYATAGIARNRPSTLPALTEIPVQCGLRDGRWQITANPGSLEADGP